MIDLKITTRQKTHMSKTRGPIPKNIVYGTQGFTRSDKISIFIEDLLRNPAFFGTWEY